MSIDVLLRLPEPPDLLRRFTAAPHQSRIAIGDRFIHLRTNDPRLTRALGPVSCAQEPVPSQSWTLLSDPDLPASLEGPLIVLNGAVIFIRFGQSCFFAFDQERNHLDGFLPAATSDQVLHQTILPLLLSLTSETK